MDHRAGRLPAQAWAQVKPELTDARFWVFQIGLLMGGHLFAERHAKK